MFVVADWNPPKAEVDEDMLPRVWERGGVPAGFCWGCEKGGRADDE